MVSGDGPLWLCTFEVGQSVFQAAESRTEAASVCVESGLPEPIDVHLGGYVADGSGQEHDDRAALRGELVECDALPSPDRTVRPADPRARRRAELVLALYALLRADFPVKSILRPYEKSIRLPSIATLRDFVSEVGLVLSRMTGERELVRQVVSSQSDAWKAGAREKNLRGRRRMADADREAERRIRHQRNAARLRKRVGYRKAIDELSAALDGVLPRAEPAIDNFRRQLSEAGVPPDEAESMIDRVRRITAPKL